MKEEGAQAFESKALRVNLEATRVQGIEFSRRYQVLCDAVQNYQGIMNTAEHLLYEIHHPFKNWDVIINEFRAFALKNLHVYTETSRAKDAIEVILELFVYLINGAPKERYKKEAIDALLAFYEKMFQSVATDLLRALIPSIERNFGNLLLEGPPVFRFMTESLHPLPSSIKALINRFGVQDLPPSFIKCATLLVGSIRRQTYEIWLSSEDPLKWFKKTIKRYGVKLPKRTSAHLRSLLESISHKNLRKTLKEIVSLITDEKKICIETLQRLLDIPGNIEIVRRYRTISRELCDYEGLCLLFFFYIMELPGLSIIHEETIRNINRILIKYIKNADTARLKYMLPKEFELLEQQVRRFPQTALQCIDALGKEILRLKDPQITEPFLERIIGFGFQTPNVQGVDMEWHLHRNPAHLQNIRVWMNLIEQDPSHCSTLLSALLINIKLGGICLNDTDLFQKDVSRLLNSDIRPVYNLVKQLTKQFPVYFNEIGAEGLLRDVSTDLDEITSRQDRLIHFLRKQSHVESNNLIVDFLEAILCFWYSKEKKVLRPYVPKEILEEIPTYGPFIDPVHRLVKFLSEELGLEPFTKRVATLVGLDERFLERLLSKVSDVPQKDRERFILLIKMYRLETLKYKLGTQEIIHHLEEARNFGFEGIEEVITAIRGADTRQCLNVILRYLEYLKGIILSPERFESRENIYLKRHIAVDIPSMYGRYHEKKFDALGLTFRLENLANNYFERLITDFDLKFITRSKLKTILGYLRLLWRAVRLDGIQSKTIETYLTLLEQAIEFKECFFGQYRDIISGLLEGVKDIIYVYYIDPHQENLPLIINQLYPERLKEKLRLVADRCSNNAELVHQLSERFLRDLISGTFGLQYLDMFISRIHQVFEAEKEALSENDLGLLLTYTPENAICPIKDPPPETKNLIHLGNKAYNLILLDEEGIPVPPGIIITTEIYRCKEILHEFPKVFQELKERLHDAIHTIEDATDKRFGHPTAPLLLSVRSGAAISMPGMMSTLINVGSNMETIEGLAQRTGNLWFAWDNYRRFVQSWAMAFGVKRDVFTRLMVKHKQRWNVEKKREFTGEQMKALALQYRKVTEEMGIEIIDDPWQQLMGAIRLVLNSWESEKARAYREIMDLSDRWGTAVIIQAMTFGNASKMSGTGVVFTTNPNHKLGRVCLWGDYTPGNQGEDIVGGLVTTHPISKEQKEYLNVDDPCLEEAFPDIYQALLGHVKQLIIEKGWTHQEIEFTFESPDPKDLYILQTRDMTPKKKRSYPAFSKTSSLKKAFLGRGIGVSGGALSGRIAFTLEDLKDLKERFPTDALILVRSDTVPDDIKEISLADGLLTAKGGQTSHAAIVALRLEKTCVVGFKGLVLHEQRGISIIQGMTFKAGDFISIDGRNGSVYAGRHKTYL